MGGEFLCIGNYGNIKMSVQSHNHEFVAFEVTVKEFYDYRLYYHMIDDVKIAIPIKHKQELKICIVFGFFLKTK